MSAVDLGLRLGWRELRSGELLLLVVALVIAVASVTAVSLFVDRLSRALIGESSSFLAADRRIVGSRPPPAEWRARAERLGLRAASTLNFPTMAYAAGERHALVSVKAVEAGYPLRGELIIGDQPWQVERGRVADSIPAAGEVWLEARAFPMLDVAAGDSIEIGLANFRVTRVLIREPDRQSGFADLGPRALINMDDVERTGVIQPGSRVSWRLLLAGDDALLQRLKQELQAEMEPEYRWQGIVESNRNIGSALTRAQRFLRLGGLLAVALAGVAIALAAWRFALRQTDAVAVLKTLGAGPRNVLVVYSALLLSLGVFSTALGLALGWLVQVGIVVALADMLEVVLPAPGLAPWVVGAVTAAVCLAGFAMPPVLALARIAPMRVIRRESASGLIPARLSTLTGVVAVVVLLRWYAGEWGLAAQVLLGAVLVGGVFGLAATGLLASGRRVGAQAGSVWRLALAALRRRAATSVVQMLAFGLAIMLLLVLTLMRTALLDEWQAQIPVDTPNHFILNMMPDEIEPVSRMLAAGGAQRGDVFPMLRGRVVTINGEDAGAYMRAHGDAEVAAPQVTSERNLGYARDLPVDNEILAGRWWDTDTPGLTSLEAEYARRAGITVGDELSFDVGGRRIQARVGSIRSVPWDNMRPNFYVLFTPSTLSDLPVTSMTSFHLAPDNKRFLVGFLREFPTITLIEVDAVIEQIQRIVARVTRAVELMLVLVLASGGVVLVASVYASVDERIAEHALLRALGGGRARLRGAQLLEFGLLGAMAGLLAACGAELSVWALQRFAFELDWSWHPWVYLAGPVAGALLVGALGMLATRQVTRVPPMAVLRQL